MSENTVDALSERLEKLEKIVENHGICHLDNHEDMRRLASRINESQVQLQRDASRLMAQIESRLVEHSATIRTVVERARQSVEEISQITKAALSPQGLAAIKIGDDAVGKALQGRVIVTRPASREEIKAGVGIVVRQATREEQK